MVLKVVTRVVWAVASTEATTPHKKVIRVGLGNRLRFKLPWHISQTSALNDSSREGNASNKTNAK